VEIDAVQWTTDNKKEVDDFLKGSKYWFSPEIGKSLNKKYWTISIVTLEGVMVCGVGDWIIKGIKGEFYPCKADIFALTYEEIA
jgi:hypothetical protein